MKPINLFFLVAGLVAGLLFHWLISLMPIVIGPVMIAINPLPQIVYITAVLVMCVQMMVVVAHN